VSDSNERWRSIGPAFSSSATSHCPVEDSAQAVRRGVRELQRLDYPKVIADVTTSDIKIEGLVISAPTISMNSTERQRWHSRSISSTSCYVKQKMQI